MTTIYTGIDFQSTGKKNNKKKDNKIVISCVSRLRPRKGHKYLIEALELINKKLKNVEVWIVGEGEMREALEKQVKASSCRNIEFLGERNDVAKLLSQSDIYVLPTTSDTLPIAIIEAMFANKAIITTNVGGIPEIIQDQQTGLIVEPGDAQQLAEKLLLLLNDPELRDNLAENAKAFAKKYLTDKIMAEKVEEIYQSFCTEVKK